MIAAFTVPLTGFEVPFEIVVLGVITGMIYSLLGMGLVLVYRSARVINFAHGDMGAFPAGLLLLAVVRWDVPYPAALALALVAAVVIGGLVEFLVIRRLTDAPRLVVLVATIGVSQILLALNLLIPRDDLGPVTYPTPFQLSFSLGDLRLGAGELLILSMAPAATAGLMFFLHRSRIGLGSRASAENLEAAKLAGVPTRRVSVAVWVLAALLSTLAAVLIAPTRAVGDVSTSLGPSLMLSALAAAMLGGMASYPQVFAAGIGIGLVELLTAWNHPTGGVVEIVLLTVILLSLVVRKGLGAVRRGAEESGWSLGAGVHALAPALASHPRVRAARRTLLVALAVAAVVAPLPMQSAQRVLLSSVLLYAVMGLSVVVLTGFAGQVSLGQYAFVALGAAVGGRMFQLGYPAWMGILYAVAAGGVTAMLVGLPAVRLRGLFLAVTTLGFSVALASWLPSQDWLINVSGGRTSLELPRQRWLGVDLRSELRYYQLCLVLLVLVALLVRRIRVSGLGRAMMAVRDNEPAAATYSLSPRRVKLVAFAVSGMIASFAGYFFGGLLVNFTDAGLFSANAAGFGGAAAGSLALVSMVIFGGVTTVTGALLGALWIRGIPYMFGSNFGILSSGLGIIVVLQMAPGGLVSVAFRVRDRLASWLTGLPPDELGVNARAEGAARASLPAKAPEEPGPGDGSLPLVPLAGRRLTVRFGGLTAVDDVTLEARRGEIVGLVGPNGAGKTTLFDVLSGQLRPDAGGVLLHGADVTALRPEARARLGLGRTFQEARLFPELPLLDTLELALERHDPSEAVPSMLALPPSLRSERAKRARAREIVELLGLGTFARRNCSELSTGTRRLAELGCVIAMGCDVVLLDEPAAGIAQREVEAFTPVLREVRDHLGATVVVIDHDLPMILGLVDRLYVMATGQVIAEGDPHALRHDPAVVAAYLGADERVIQRSGGTAAARPAPAARRRRPLRAGTPVGAARHPT